MTHRKPLGLTSRTAMDAYRKQMAESQKLLREVQAKLANHARRQQASPDDWGFSGDLEEYNRHLRIILGCE